MRAKKPPRTVSAFKGAVIAAVKAIEPGNTLSYREVAKAAGYASSFRAVARLMSQNFDETIPCHRVIYSSGKLGHYNRGGEAVKRKRLESEGWTE